MGMKEIRFSSRPIHTYNQFVLEMAMIVPKIKVDLNNMVDGKSIEL